MEPMEEVNYIDQLRLVSVDHPANVEVNPDERFLDDPPFASGRVIASETRGCPSARGMAKGTTCWQRLSAADHRFASGFTAFPTMASRTCIR